MFSEQLPVCRPQFNLLDRDYCDGGEPPTGARRPLGGAGAAAERPPSRAGSDSPSALQLDRRRPNTTAGRFATARWGQPSHTVTASLWPAAVDGVGPPSPAHARPSQRRPMTSAGTSARGDFDRMAKHTLITMSVLPSLSAE